MQLRATVLCFVIGVVAMAACSSGAHKPLKAAKASGSGGPVLLPGAAAGNSASGSGPWDICGQHLALSQAGFFVEDASDHDITVTRKSPGDYVVLHLSDDCNAKTGFKVVPPDAATVYKQAPPTGDPVGVVLHPSAQTFVVTFERPSGPGRVTVDFTQPTPTLGP